MHVSLACLIVESSELQRLYDNSSTTEGSMIAPIILGVIAGAAATSWSMLFMLCGVAAATQIPKARSQRAAFLRARSYDPELVETMLNLGALNSADVEAVRSAPVGRENTIVLFVVGRAFVVASGAAIVTRFLLDNGIDGLLFVGFIVMNLLVTGLFLSRIIMRPGNATYHGIMLFGYSVAAATVFFWLQLHGGFFYMLLITAAVFAIARFRARNTLNAMLHGISDVEDLRLTTHLTQRSMRHHFYGCCIHLVTFSVTYLYLLNR